MKIKTFFYIIAVVFITYIISITTTGCAQMGQPTGGPRDSLAPVLISANPKMLTTNFSGNRISLTFDEYIVLQDAQTNVLMSPYPKVNPQFDFKLKTVTVKIKDTLRPNTTYAIDFGDAIRDNNEGNPYKNFTYVFSTGNTIDSLKFNGNVILAETGKTDSTFIALLYRTNDDSAVHKRKPDYVAKLDSSGRFTFRNLSPGIYKIYALKDGDGSKTYNSSIEFFAFADTTITVSDSSSRITLYAYAEERDIPRTPATTTGKPATQAEKRLRYTTGLANNTQDILSDFKINFLKPLKIFDSARIFLSDTNYNRIDSRFTIDSSRKSISIQTKWNEDTHYRLIIDKDALSDSADNKLLKSDTLRFTTKRESEYGNLVLRFTKLDTAKHPVLQFIRGEEIIKSVPITRSTWSDRLFYPGDYEMRILYDANNNGVWDPGNYDKKVQPERATTLDSRLSIKANWDNERDIEL